MRTRGLLILVILACAALGWALRARGPHEPAPPRGAQRDPAVSAVPPPVLGGGGAGAPAASPAAGSGDASRGGHADDATTPVGTVIGRVLAAGGDATLLGVPVFFVAGRDRLSSDIPKDATPSVTDAAGHYRFDRVPVGAATVFAFGAGWVSRGLTEVDCSSGFDPLYVDVRAGRPTTQDLVVIPAARVRGRILDAAGAAIPNARARALQWDSSRGGCDEGHLWGSDFPFVPDPPPVAVDPEGRYEIATLLPGVRYQTDGTAEGYERSSENVKANSDEAATLELVLVRVPPAWFLEVEVRDRETGEPIAGARPGSGRTDENGVARIGPLRGSRMWGAYADGYFRADLDVEPPDDLTGEAPTRRVVVLLDRAAMIAGTVIAPDGAPVPHATVRVGAPVDLSDRWAGPSEWTDEHGAFCFDKRDPKDPAVPFHAAWKHEGRMYRGKATAAPGDGSVEIRLRLVPIDHALVPRVIALLGGTGEPVAKARVWVHTVVPEDPEEGAPAERDTDSTRAIDGRCLVAPSRVPFRLQIQAAGDAGPWGAVLLGPYDETAAIPEVITLPPARTIRGRVLGDTGAPAPGLEVEATVRFDAWPDSDLPPPRTVHATTNTDARGEFVLERLGDFAYRIRVKTPAAWRRPEIGETRPGEGPLEIRLERTHACTITVLDPRGDPVPGASIGFARLDDSQGKGRRQLLGRSHETDAHGRCSVLGLDPHARYELRVGLPFHLRDRWASASLDNWRPGDTTVRLEAPRLVLGVVVDAEGRGIRGASVVARRAETSAASFYEYDFTDEDGRFHLAAVPSGRARLTVKRGSYLAPVEHVIDVPVDGDLRLVCPRGRTVEVHLGASVPGGEPVGSQVAGPTAKGTFQSCTWRPQVVGETFRIEHLLPGQRYSLLLDVPSRGLVAHVPAFSADAGTIRPTFAPSRTIHGRLLPPSGGARVPDATVRFTLGAFTWETESESDGSFTIAGLPAGEGTLRARVRRDGTFYEAEVVVAAGATVDVRLTKTE